MRDGPRQPRSRLAEPDADFGLPAIGDCGILRHQGQWISLSPTQEAVLRLLVDRFGEPVSRAAITEAAWPDDAPDAHTIDIHIHRLRPRLLEIGLVIHTLRGRGFLLERSET